MIKLAFPVINCYDKQNNSTYEVVNNYVKLNGVAYKVINQYIVGEQEASDFEWEIDTSIWDDTSYSINCTMDQQPSFTVNWGDGTLSNITLENYKNEKNHEYANPGKYIISITNYVSGYFVFTGDSYLTKVLKHFPVQAGRTSFNGCFYGCGHLISLPEKLFINNPGVTDFSSCFERCDGLTILPYDLFYYCPNVITFEACFCFCRYLISLPNGLFDYCPNVVTFKKCFYYCINLTNLPDGFFDNCLMVMNFEECFYTCLKITGYAPALWLRTNPTPYGRYCFALCTLLANYDDIPSGWR